MSYKTLYSGRILCFGQLMLLCMVEKQIMHAGRILEELIVICMVSLAFLLSSEVLHGQSFWLEWLLDV